MGQAIRCSLKAHFNCSFKCALKSYPPKKKKVHQRSYTQLHHGLEEIPLNQFGIKFCLLFLFFNKKYKAQHTNRRYGG